MQITKKVLFSLFIFSTSTSFSIEPVTTALIISAAAQSYPVLKDGVQSFFPNKEQELNDKITKERLKYIETREQFGKCLFASNSKSQRVGAMNCPVHCKELMIILLKLNGRSEVIELIQSFDDAMQNPNDVIQKL